MNHPRILPTLTPSHHLHLILGCMYSGKTTELIRLLGTYEMAHINCLLIKLDKDVRYGEGTKEVQTHDGMKRKCVSVGKLSDISDDVTKDYSVIGIDEGQFFGELLETTLKWSVVMKKIVIVAALNGTFNGKMFAPVTSIMPFITSISYLTAICQYCHGVATLSMRTSCDTQEMLIAGKSTDGTKDLYEAVCCDCYVKNSPFSLPINNDNTNSSSGTTNITVTATHDISAIKSSSSSVTDTRDNQIIMQ